MAANPEYVECLASDDRSMERVRFFQRQLLSAEDMIAEQEYFRQKLRRHNRFLHGWGVVCGLAVEPAPTAAQPWRVRVTGGYALGPYGDDIHVPDPVYFDLAECGAGGSTDPCEPSVIRRGSSPAQGTVYLAIKYAECVTRPVRAMPEDCGCDADNCQYSRIRDSFELGCLPELPPSHGPTATPPLCDLIRSGRTLPCPPCAEDPWVVLAAISLPGSSTEIMERDIMNGVRRHVFSTAVLQDQLIRCCCDGVDPQDTLRVTDVSFLNVEHEAVARLNSDLSVNVLGDNSSLVADTVAGIQISLNAAVNVDSVQSAGEIPFELRMDDAVVPLAGIAVTGGGTEIVIRFIRPITDFALNVGPGRGLQAGDYTATLYGEDRAGGRAVLDTQGRPLDGEMGRLPTGNGEAGGDFEFEFVIETNLI